MYIYTEMVELVVTLVLETSALMQCEFESRFRYNCLDSSEVERRTVNPLVVGSTPTQDAINTLRSSNWLGHSPFTGKLTGSSPVRSTKKQKL